LIAKDEGLKEGEESPDDTGEWQGLGELEIFQDHSMVLVVQVKFSDSTFLAAIVENLYVVKDVPDDQVLRPVVDDPMEAYIEDDEVE